MYGDSYLGKFQRGDGKQGKTGSEHGYTTTRKRWMREQTRGTTMCSYRISCYGSEQTKSTTQDVSANTSTETYVHACFECDSLTTTASWATSPVLNRIRAVKFSSVTAVRMIDWLVVHGAKRKHVEGEEPWGVCLF
jgi:hypothetical protein